MSRYKILTISDLESRIEKLRKIPDGWYDGEGSAIPENILVLAENTFKHMFRAHSIPIPYLYPSLECSLCAEWDIEGFMINVDIKESGEFYFHALNVKTDESWELDTSSVLELVKNIKLAL